LLNPIKGRILFHCLKPALFKIVQQTVRFRTVSFLS